MGDYTDRTSPAEMDDNSVLSGNRIHPKHQVQPELPKVSVSETLAAQAQAINDEEDEAQTPRAKTGGRQKGTPNKVQRVDIVKICRLYSLQAVETILDVMNDVKESGATRLAAATALLDRAHGKPKQMVEHSGIDGEEIQSRLVIEFVGQPPIKATVDAQIEDASKNIIDMQLETVRVPEQRKPWDPA